MKTQLISIQLCRLQKAMELLNHLEVKLRSVLKWNDAMVGYNADEHIRYIDFLHAVKSRIEVYIHRHSAKLDNLVNH